jgi:hypothetical protein
MYIRLTINKLKIIAEGYHTIFFRNFEEKKKGGGLSYPQVPVGAMYRFSLKKKKKLYTMYVY